MILSKFLKRLMNIKKNPIPLQNTTPKLNMINNNHMKPKQKLIMKPFIKTNLDKNTPLNTIVKYKDGPQVNGEYQALLVLGLIMKKVNNLIRPLNMMLKKFNNP